jgi:exopolysaccharide biosynthesis polyprenyl glycosylphosphotransferase
MSRAAMSTLLEIQVLIDLAACMGAFIFATAIDPAAPWREHSLLLQRPVLQLVLATALIWTWHMSLVGVGAYRSHRLSEWPDVAIMLGQGSLLATCCLAVWSVPFLALSGTSVSAPGLAVKVGIFFVGTYLLLFTSRLIARSITRLLRRRGRNLRHVLLVGTNQRAIAVATFLTQHASLGYRLSGFVDDRWHSEHVPPEFAHKLVGDLSAFPQLLRTLPLDEVVVALPIASHYESIRRVATQCRQQGIIVRCEGSLFDLQSPLGLRKSVPTLITLHDECWGTWSILTKRSLDIVVSASALLILAPLLLVIACVIRSSTPGPVFFCQERVGLGKRRFKIIKFRSMVHGAEGLISGVEHLNESAGPTFKLANDPRITPIGHLLRRTSLDELPQFINVLLGDMSLVGPRPLPVRDYIGFSEDWHRRRFSVKPGITCLWQIRGRSAIPFEQWMELDISYIDTRSFWLDLSILLQTIPVVLKGSGAA